jgi:hypothetical protein
MLNNYKDFFSKRFEGVSINENIQQAKRWLAEKEIKETNPNYIKIKEMLSKNPGWVFVFTKFLFDEKVSFEDIQAMYNTLKEYRESLSLLPQTVDKYDGRKSTEDGHEVTLNFEKLTDDIQTIERKKKAKSLFDEFPQVLKADYRRCSPEMKAKLEDAAVAFSELKPEQQKGFVGKISKYKSLQQLIRNLDLYIKGNSSASVESLLDNIDEANQYLNDWLKVDVVYVDEKNEIVVADIKTWESLRKLCIGTSWCIVSGAGMWNSYVGDDRLYNKQYVIWNFSLGTANQSMIGITINENGGVRAAHAKNDSNFTGELQSYCKKYGIPYSKLRPMTDEEKDKKRRFVVANAEIKKPQKSIERIGQLIKDGADINTDKGKPIKNALESGNLEMVAFMVQNGADLNIDPEIVKSCSNFKTLKFLVDNGADIATDRYWPMRKMCELNDTEGVKYFVKMGSDVNIMDTFSLRWAIRSNNIELIKFLIDNGANIQSRANICMKWGWEYCNLETLKFLIDNYRDKIAISKDVVTWGKNNERPGVKEYIKTIIEKYGTQS